MPAAVGKDVILLVLDWWCRQKRKQSPYVRLTPPVIWRARDNTFYIGDHLFRFILVDKVVWRCFAVCEHVLPNNPKLLFFRYFVVVQLLFWHNSTSSSSTRRNIVPTKIDNLLISPQWYKLWATKGYDTHLVQLLIVWTKRIVQKKDNNENNSSAGNKHSSSSSFGGVVGGELNNSTTY